jgi:hypothetical protein
MPTRESNMPTCKPVPVEFSGQWIAWNADHSEIVAHADSLTLLWQRVREKSVDDPVFEKVPLADVRFAGMT